VLPPDGRAHRHSPTEPSEILAQIETIFRGPKAREIKLTNEFKQDKRHGWLEKKEKNIY